MTFTSKNMTFRSILAIAAFTTLAGCANTTPVASYANPGANPESNTAQAISEELGDERDLVTYEFMVDVASKPSAYRIQADATTATTSVTLPVKRPAEVQAHAPMSSLSAEVRAAWVANRAAYLPRMTNQFAALAADRAKLVAAFNSSTWAEQSTAGTRSKTLSFTVDRQVMVLGQARTLTRQVVMTRTTSSDGSLVLASDSHMSSKYSDGTSRTASRAQSLQSDGRVWGAYSADLNLINGGTRMADWNTRTSPMYEIQGTGALVAMGPNGSNRNRSFDLTVTGMRKEPTLTAIQRGVGSVVGVYLSAEGEAVSNAPGSPYTGAMNVSANPALAVDASL